MYGEIRTYVRTQVRKSISLLTGAGKEHRIRRDHEITSLLLLRMVDMSDSVSYVRTYEVRT